jgi:selenocysteine lyase/cysteine desulfurase
VIFCVDAIQGLGAFQLDVETAGIDFLACGGHKWLMATQGIGLLYCTEALQDRIRPPAGWLHGPVDWEHLDRYDLAFHPEARRYEIGTRNNAGIAALHAALGLYFEAGPVWCEAQVQAHAQRLAAGLADLGFTRYGPRDPHHTAGIVTIRAKTPEALFDHLRQQNITAALRNRLVRFAPTYYNSSDEMDRILEAVEAFAAAPSAASN